MRWLLAVLLAFCGQAHAMVGEDCTWNNPGAEPYTGPRSKAIMSYNHIRYDQRLALAFMVRHQQPSDVVAITRDGISSSSTYSYGAGVNGMHFGRGRKCGTVTRDAWPADKSETARVWCLDRWCILIPDVCGNVAWTVRDALPAGVLRSLQPRNVPEPGTLALVAAAAFAALLARKTRRPMNLDDKPR